MTKPLARCAWCRGVLADPAPVGRPRRYCKRSCRQRAYEERAFARAHGLGPDQIVVDRPALEALLDRRYELQLVAADLDRWQVDPEPGEALERLAWLTEAVAAVVASDEPRLSP